MNLSPDPRQLKTKISLSILNAPESGFFSGEYTATSASKSQDNLNVLNYDFETYYTYEDNTTEAKYSSKLRILSSLQNARIPEVNTAISASSCTFAFGGIVPGEVDSVLDRLKGPSYSVNFVDDVKQGTVTGQQDNFGNNSLHNPKIPFAGSGKVLTTYNIWHVVNGGLDAYKEIGPAIAGKNTGTLRTVKDPNYGAQVEVTSIQTDTIVKRIFPTCFDAIYDNGAELHNPDGTRSLIKATGLNGNNGFHINFSASNMQPNTSGLKIYFRPVVINDDFINDFIIEFKLDSKPLLKIYDPDLKDYIVQKELIAPILDNNTMKSYDVFVHFVGPNILIGFYPDITKWNTIINYNNREIYCPPFTEVLMSLSNVNVKFRYSAIIFNNYNNNQPKGFNKNYIIAELKYSQKKIKSVDKLLELVKKSFEDASYRINDVARNTGFNNKNPIDKNISYFADLRLNGRQFEEKLTYKFPKAKSADEDKKTIYVKLVYDTTIEGPAFMQMEIPHPGVLAAGGAANFGSSGTGAIDYGFSDPILKNLFFKIGDITSWVESWNVSCDAQLSNLSKIVKSADITLKNLDTKEGQKFIDAIENNLIVITIDAGYVEGSLYTFFQGIITSTSYSRRGNDSTFSLTCSDLGTFILENLYFEKNMLIAGMRHDLAIDSMIASSGFWSYYSRNNNDFENGIPISGIDLRLNSNSTNNQDLIKLNPLDKIYDKLGLLLERLNNPYSLPTFRWRENYGFVLECRNNYVDSDLKFTGLNSSGNAYLFNSNDLSNTDYIKRFQQDLHGLLVDQYTIATDMNLLSAGVRVFGSSITGFLADERFSPGSVSILNLPVQTQLDLLDYLALAPYKPSQPNYIGFKKYINIAKQRNEIPDQLVLKRYTDAWEIISKTPISKISFSCYVVKPLQFHGKFIINSFLGNSVNATDKYVYTNVSYRYDKSDNLITATVSGTNMPISLGAL